MKVKAQNNVRVMEMILSASCPEDIFGNSSTITIDEVEISFKRMCVVVHPDLGFNGGALQDMSTRAFTKLSQFLQEAKLKIQQCVYGNKNVRPASDKNITFRVRNTNYHLTALKHTGTTAATFSGSAVLSDGTSFPIIAKIPHNYCDNDLLAREAKSLKTIYDFSTPKKTGEIDCPVAAFQTRVPQLVTSIKLKESNLPERRIVNIFRYPADLSDGWYTLEDIRSRYIRGVNTRIMAFIINRVLEGLTLAHMAKVVHGSLLPKHILIHAKQHAGLIIDWTCACIVGSNDRIPFVDDEYMQYYPTGVASGDVIPTKADDIYMLGWSMVYLLGGEIGNERDMTGTIPSHVEKPIRDLLNQFVQPRRKLRPSDAEQAYRAFSGVLDKVFGQRRMFAELNMD